MLTKSINFVLLLLCMTWIFQVQGAADRGEIDEGSRPERIAFSWRRSSPPPPVAIAPGPGEDVSGTVNGTGSPVSSPSGNEMQKGSEDFNGEDNDNEDEDGIMNPPPHVSSLYHGRGPLSQPTAPPPSQLSHRRNGSSPAPEEDPFTTRTNPIYDSPPPPMSIPGSSGVQRVRWCCVGPAELLFCKAILPVLNVPGAMAWTCVEQDSPSLCMDAIGRGEAELIGLEAGLAYVAFISKSMKALLAERLDDGEHYDAVAVVRDSKCPRSVRQAHRGWKVLRGARSCHPYYASGAGWSLPLQHLLDSGLATPKSAALALPNDIEVMSSFFSASCAPGDSKGPRMCEACGENASCDSHDPYAGYPGAFHCLTDGAGDVAFLKTPVVTKYAQGGKYAQDWSKLPTSAFRFLCPDGGCIGITDNPAAQNCTLGQVAANVIMTRNSINETEKVAIIARLQQAGSIPRWASALYESNNPNEFLLSSSARGLVTVHLTRPYLGAAGVASAQNFKLNEIVSPAAAPASTYTWSWLNSLLLAVSLLFAILTLL